MVRQRLNALAACDATVPGSPPALIGDVERGLRVESPADSRRHYPTRDSGFQSLVNQVVELARILTGASGSVIAFRGERGTICAARSGEIAPPLGARVAPGPQASPVLACWGGDITSGIFKQCLDSGTTLWCADVASDGVDSEMSQTVGFRAIAVAPIYRGNHVRGILGVFSRGPCIFTDLHLKWLQQMAAWVGATENIPGEISMCGPSAETSGWNNIFVETRIPWNHIIESVVLHVIAVGVLLGLSSIWPRELPLYRQPLSEVSVTYYPFSQSFPANESSRSAEDPRQENASARPAADRDRAPGGDSDAGSTTDGPKVSDPIMPSPAMPGLSINNFQKPGLDSAVSPPPDSLGAHIRQPQQPNLPVIAPPPELGSSSGSRMISAPKAAVIAPSPDIGGAVVRAATSDRFLGPTDISIVPPAPSLNQRAALTYTPGGVIQAIDAQVVGAPPAIQGRLGPNATAFGLSARDGVSQVVPPPPTLGIGGNSLGGGRSNSSGVAVVGAQVVPPPPSIAGGGSVAGGAGLVSSVNLASQVVPPPPAVAGGAGNGRGVGVGGSAGIASSGDLTSQVVPPPPSVAGLAAGKVGASFAGGGGIGSSADLTSQVVPPPPSVSGMAGGGVGGGGRAGSLAHSSLEAALPPVSPGNNSGNNSKIGGAGVADDISPSSPESGADGSHAMYQDVQLRVIGLAWAPRRSSYFSNFEVFIAEKWFNKEESQFIKLVYVFLPYQRRLSEYGSDALRIRRLRVKRDSTCDESLIEMTWPDNDDARTDFHTSSGELASASNDRSGLLPCYLTTADDYRQSVSRSR